MTSIFDLQIFCLLYSNSSLSLYYFFDSRFSVDFQVSLDCQRVDKINFGIKGDKVLLSSKSESKNTM